MTEKDMATICCCIPFKKIRLLNIKKHLSSNLNNASKRVLIIEPNPFHFELLPSRAHLFIKLGYEVDIISNKEAEFYNSFTRFNSDKVNILYLDYEYIVEIFFSKIISQYEYVLLNTTYDYGQGCLFFNLYPIKYYPKKYLILSEHSFENIKNYKIDINEKMLVCGLNIPDKYKGVDYIFAMRAFYFGEIKSNISKLGKTIITIPGFHGKKLEYLISIVKNAIEYGCENFKFIVIDKHLENTQLFQKQVADNSLTKYIEIAGKVTFETMFEIIEKSRFLFSCLDTEDENHIRYKTVRTTGALQMSMAVLKPLIIEKSFADFHHLDNNNAIVYNGNQDFVLKFKEALKMKDNEFAIMQKSIKELSHLLEEETLNFLKNK